MRNSQIIHGLAWVPGPKKASYTWLLWPPHCTRIELAHLELLAAVQRLGRWHETTGQGQCHWQVGCDRGTGSWRGRPHATPAACTAAATPP